MTPGPMGFILIAASLAGGMALAIEAGRSVSRRALADSESERQGLGALEGAVFGLLGLMIAFTFSGAMQRFETRRTLVLTEANAIGTAWMRLDLVPEPRRGELHALFRSYLDARVEIYGLLAAADVDAARAALARSTEVQREIWSSVMAACDEHQESRLAMLVVPPINEMFDITTIRTAALSHHAPVLIHALLFVLALGSSFLAGRAMSPTTPRHWTHVLVFTWLMALAVYVILDIEYPRAGLIRVDAVDQVLVELRATMR